MTRVLINKSLSDTQKNRLTQAFPQVEFIYSDPAASIETLAREAAQCEILVGTDSGSLVTAALGQPNKIRWIQSWFAGVNTLPLDLLKEHQVQLVRAAGVSIYAMSETAIGLIIMLTRKFQIYARQQQEQRWQQLEWPEEVHGKTVGILGLGAIGLQTAKAAKGLGMTVWGYRRHAAPSEFADRVVDDSGLPELLATSDFVINILPLTKDTRYQVNGEFFAKMKTGAYYINIGRGMTTDTGALLDALKSGRLRGAGLDVVDPEPLPAESPLWKMDNVIVLPHQAGFTSHYHDRTLEIFMRNLKSYEEQGNPTESLVNLDAEY